MKILKKFRQRYGKRAMALLMLFSLLFTSMNLQTILSFGDSDQESFDIGGDLTCVLYSDGRLVISGNGGSSSFDKETAPFLKFSDQVKYLEIEEGVTSLGDYLFYGCRNLSGQLILPESLIHIGTKCFGGRNMEDAPKFEDVISLFVGGDAELGGPGDSTETAAATGSNAVLDMASPSDASPSDASASDAEVDPWSGPGVDPSMYPEQVIDGDLFYPGQSGNFYCLDSNESFKRLAVKAGYSRAKYGAMFTLCYGEGPMEGGMTDVCYYLLSSRQEASAPKLPALYVPGQPDGLYEDHFTGWIDEAGEPVKSGAKVVLSEEMPAYTWTAGWERKPIELIEEQTSVTMEDGLLHASVTLRDVPGFTLSCQWYVSDDYREKTGRPEDASWRAVEGADGAVYEREISPEDETRYYTCEVSARKSMLLDTVSRIAGDADTAGSQFSEPASLGLIPKVTASAAAGKQFEGLGEMATDAVNITGDSAVTVQFDLSGLDAALYQTARISGDFPAGTSVVMTAAGSGELYYYVAGEAAGAASGGSAFGGSASGTSASGSSVPLTEFLAMDGSGGNFELSRLDRGDGVLAGTLVFVLDYRGTDAPATAEECQAELMFEAQEGLEAADTGAVVSTDAAEEDLTAGGSVSDISGEVSFVRGPKAEWTVSLDDGGRTVQTYGGNPVRLSGQVHYLTGGIDTAHEDGYTSLELELYDETGSTPVDFPMGMVVYTDADSALKGIISGNQCVVNLGKITDGSTAFTVSLDPGKWGLETGTYSIKARVGYGAAPGSKENQDMGGREVSVALSVHNPDYVLEVKETSDRMGAKTGEELSYELSYTCSEGNEASGVIYRAEVLKKAASGYEAVDPQDGWQISETAAADGTGVCTVTVPELASGTYRLRFTMTVHDPWRGTVTEESSLPLIIYE